MNYENAISDEKQYIILFDGICNLCDSTVQFIIKRDKSAKFKFAPLQSEYGRQALMRLGLPEKDYDSFVLIRGDRYFLRSSAGLRVLNELGGFWRIFFVFILIPPFIRDIAYRIVAETRYKIFGRKEFCMTPSPDLKERFLG